MILADSTVWNAYLTKRGVPDLDFARLVGEGEIVCHPWILGELLLGGLRPTIARELRRLEFLPVARHDEVIGFVERHHPQGVGWVDVNLLVSSLGAGARLWTLDGGLRANALKHGAWDLGA